MALFPEVKLMDKTQRPLQRAVAAAFPHTIPVLTGYLVLGIAYGVLMQTKGYGAPWALLMSGLAFCGSMQFVAITLLTTAFDPLQAFLMSLMVNARHLFYGVSMLGKYRGLGGVKPVLIYLLSDFKISTSFVSSHGSFSRWSRQCWQSQKANSQGR